MKLRKIVPITILVMMLIDLGSVYGVWGEIKAGRPDFFDLYRSGLTMRQHAADKDQPLTLGSASERIDRLHPPFETMGFAFLARLIPIDAYRVWLLANMLMLWSVPVILWRHVPELQADYHYVAIFFGSFLFVFIALIQGQDSILLLLLLTLGFVLARRNSNLLAGMVLGLGVFKFFIVLPVIAAIGLGRQVRLILGALLSIAALFAISFFAVGINGTTSYYANLFTFAQDPTSHAATNAALMPNVRGLITTFAPVTQSGLGLLSLEFVSVTGILAVIVWSSRNREKSPDLAYAACVTGCSAFSYHYFLHNAVILLLPLLLAANHFASSKASRVNRALFGISAASMYAIPNIVSAEVGAPVIAAATLGLLAALIRETHQRGNAVLNAAAIA